MFDVRIMDYKRSPYTTHKCSSLSSDLHSDTGNILKQQFYVIALHNINISKSFTYVGFLSFW